jgi:group I intron endonuclease
MTAYIYGLVDDRDPNEIRYVGKASNVSVRLGEHKRNKKTHSHKIHWINKVLSEGGDILIIVLEECSDEDWKDREIFWIAKLRSEGKRLTNSTMGGDGVLVAPRTPETLAKMSEAQRGKIVTQETRQRMSESHKVAMNTPEAKANMSAAKKGKKFTPEHRAKIAAALKGNKNKLGKHHGNG